MKQPEISFNTLLDYFPKLELPVTLTEQSAKHFSLHNKPIPDALVHTFLLSEEEQENELIEVVPCFQFDNTGDFIALLFWKANIMNYEYILATFDKNGVAIDAKVVAGIVSNGDSIIRTVATIDPDWIIHVVVGEEFLTKEKASETKAFSMELVNNGEILFSLNQTQPL